VATLAKLTRPKPHRIVPRERLFDALDRLRDAAIVWVSGPPGAGKTMLVASYVAARRIPALWYQIDPGDRDAATFFHYLSDAAHSASRRRTPSLPVLGMEHRGDMPGFVRLYARALFKRTGTPALLVLDNYHALTEDTDLHELLQILAGEIPHGACLLVTSRAHPPPAFAALRATLRMAMLEWDELRLTPDETRAIAASRNVLDADTLQKIHDLAGGWPVGVTLTLEQLRHDAQATAHGYAERELLFDYFAGQIFAALPDITREVAMCVALLPTATAAQATALCGDDRAGDVLDELYRRRLFVDRLGAAYQLHDLFRAFLMAQFDVSRSLLEAQALRRRAAGILAESGQIEAAFTTACAVPDWEMAGEIVLQFAAQLLEQGRGATLRHWFQTLPVERIESSPWLGFWQAVSQASTMPAVAREGFETAYERFSASGDKGGCLLCCGAILMTHYLAFDGFPAVDRWLDALSPLLVRQLPWPAVAAELRFHTALLFALSFRRPQALPIAACVTRMKELMRSDCRVNVRIDAAALLLSHFVDCAQFEDAAEIVMLTEPWLGDGELSPFYRAMWTVQLARHEAERGDLVAAERAYAAVAGAIDDNALTAPVLKVALESGRSQLALLCADPDAADAARRRLPSQINPVDQTLDAGLHAMIVRQRDDQILAVTLARRYVELADTAGVPRYAFRSRLQLAFVVADHDPRECERLLTEARSLVDGTIYGPLAYCADLVEAYAALAAGDAEQARPALVRGLEGSRCDTGLLPLRLMPGLLPRLFAHALRKDIDTSYVRQTIRKLQLAPPDADVPNWPWPLEIRTLGRFEVRNDGQPLAFSRKLPRKTLALLKVLISLGAGALSEQRLIDALWVDEEGDAAARALDATVLRLRTLLGDPAAIIQRGGTIRLNPDRTWVDVFAFERLLNAAEGTARAAGSDPGLWERALALYEGAFLAEDEGESWSVAARERLRGRFVHGLVEFGQTLERTGDFAAAIGVYQRGLAADALVEPFYQGLMRSYTHLNRPSEAISAYRRLKQMLSVVLGLAPSAATERLYQGIRDIANK